MKKVRQKWDIWGRCFSSPLHGEQQVNEDLSSHGECLSFCECKWIRVDPEESYNWPPYQDAFPHLILTFSPPFSFGWRLFNMKKSSWLFSEVSISGWVAISSKSLFPIVIKCFYDAKKFGEFLNDMDSSQIEDDCIKSVSGWIKRRWGSWSLYPKHIFKAYQHYFTQ